MSAAERNRVIAEQESLLNVYRCALGADVGEVPGGCAQGWPAGAVALAGSPGAAAMDDVAAQESLIAGQRALLGRYRCLLAEAAGAPGCCRAAPGRSDAGRAAGREARRLAELARRWDPSARVVLAVVLADGRVWGAGARQPVRSASAVKPVWAAAALANAGTGAVGGVRWSV